MRATYSPDDNKLRLYPAARLDAETYARVKGAGFIWAAKQGLFVAPMWTPEREDLLIDLCGEIDDEDTSLAERAEERAERFGEYHQKRTRDAEQARQAVKAITDGIPLGQPILVGHHSERHARKDAERIENGMRKAVRLWETAQYWTDRAKGAILHARYKERPDVRARRIKGLETDQRRQVKTIQTAEAFTRLWEADGLTWERARAIASRDHVSKCFTLLEWPRLTPEASKYEGFMSLYSALEGIITPEQAREIAVRVHTATIARHRRWLQHIENRLAYERAMLEDQGASDLLKPKPRPVQLPLCNYRAPEGIDTPNLYNRGETMHYPQIEMTAAEYARIPNDYKGTRVVGCSHRVRICMRKHNLYSVFLTDSKAHTPPEPREAVPKARPEPRPMREPEPVPEGQAEIAAMRQSLHAGVQVVAVPQLFPTPAAIARQVIELAELRDGDCVLEPSAGTGVLVQAVIDAVDTEVLAYEINSALCAELRRKFPSYKLQVRQADFLTVTDFQGQYPRVIMNPPFENGADIRHIQHARTFLRPGGRLVAVCANGPRQRATLQPIAREWIDLPPGSFTAVGTGVNAAIVVLDALEG